MRFLLAVVMFATSSCGWFGPEVVCDEAQLGGMRCAEVLDMAGTQLGGVGEISRLTVSHGIPCPIEAMSCGPDVPPGVVSTVYADLADGRRFAVPVYPADGDEAMHAGPLQEMGAAP